MRAIKREEVTGTEQPQELNATGRASLETELRELLRSKLLMAINNFGGYSLDS